MSLKSFQLTLFLGALFLMGQRPLLAHDVIPGVSGFAGRILHPFIITEHLLCLILAGLIAGLYGARLIFRSLATLIGGLALGFLSQAVIPIIEGLWMLPLGAAVIAGLLVLSAARLGARLWLFVIFVLGFVVGLETDPEGVFLVDQVQTLCGLVIAGGLLLLSIGWPLGRASRPWVRIVGRVIGSWITAIALLVLALNF